MREQTFAVGAISRDLALVLVGEQRQGCREIEDGLRQGDLEQEAHGTQAQRQHGQGEPGRSGWADLSLRARGGPPLSPLAAPRAGRRERGQRGP